MSLKKLSAIILHFPHLLIPYPLITFLHKCVSVSAYPPSRTSRSRSSPPAAADLRLPSCTERSWPAADTIVTGDRPCPVRPSGRSRRQLGREARMGRRRGRETGTEGIGARREPGGWNGNWEVTVRRLAEAELRRDLSGFGTGTRLDRAGTDGTGTGR